MVERTKPTLHCLGLAFSVSDKNEYCHCAYTCKVVKFCRMMSQRGYNVIHYGNEGAIVESHHVTVMTRSEMEEFTGKMDKQTTISRQAYWDPQSKLWRKFNGRCIAALMERVEERDIICHPGGCSQAIARAIPDDTVTNVENGIGYGGSWAQFKAFESYVMMHTTWVRQTRFEDVDGHEYEVVIPNYFDVADFPAGPGGNYLAMVAHMGSRKGLAVALAIAKHTGKKLIAGGPGLKRLSEHVYVGPDVQTPYDTTGIDFEYVGHVNPEQRAKLMGGACAVIVPTRYLEPFGGVSVEAQLYGTPVLTSDWGGFVDIVEHGIGGYRCRIPDHWVWAANNAHKLDRAKIRQRAIDRFSLEKVGAMFEEWFEMIQARWVSMDYWKTVNPERRQLDWLSGTSQHPIYQPPPSFLPTQFASKSATAECAVAPLPLYARCLVIATIGDRHAAILDAITPSAKFKTLVINHGDAHREGAINRKGYKWQNIKLALDNRHVHSIPDFDYVWFPDDDIEISTEDIHRLFVIAHNQKLRLCQPSMAANSQNIGWQITAHVPESAFRYTNFVEILAPLFSAEALATCLPTFAENYSGWGLDFIWPKLLGYKGIAVIDAVQMRHLISSSPDWKMPNGKKPREEMHETLARYELDYQRCSEKVRNLGMVPNCAQTAEKERPDTKIPAFIDLGAPKG